ncbi:YacP-like NYN domain protein [Bremerella volcania]|uniref:YacP-like NYN domain protein n=1 Tax=Bremerella volcania TaxID=2527984 RepID=A0A518C4L6_9BACT|nr:NYN domain-containing protein [Bremerella volcania]QDU74169.1 YacP-like NYN domain protein [Bremerella volcania]
MPLIIDGYNLLYAAGLVGSVDGEGSFEGERRALLDALLAVIDPKELTQTVVVFDSAKAPPGLPRVYNYQQITVRFASGYADADEMIEELIQEHHAPKRLTVVSSDHRVQRAARRRKAKAIDSDSWYRLMRQTRARRREIEAQQPPLPKRLSAPAIPESEVSQWVEFFGKIDVDALAPQEETPPIAPASGPTPEPKTPQGKPGPKKTKRSDEPAPNVFTDDYLKKIAEEFFGDA